MRRRGKSPSPNKLTIVVVERQFGEDLGGPWLDVLGEDGASSTGRSTSPASRLQGPVEGPMGGIDRNSSTRATATEETCMPQRRKISGHHPRVKAKAELEFHQEWHIHRSIRVVMLVRTSSVSSVGLKVAAAENAGRLDPDGASSTAAASICAVVSMHVRVVSHSIGDTPQDPPFG